MDQEGLKYLIALSSIKGVGNAKARKLLAFFKNPENIFKEKRKALALVPGIGSDLACKILDGAVISEAEKELAFIDKKKIEILYYTDKKFPDRLKHCIDAPLVLFYKGDCDFNASKVLSVVGTRQATHYGQEACEKIVKGLAEKYPELIIVSGLAYGIDTFAHKYALKYNLKTISVLAHGLNQIYPPANRSLAEGIIKQGLLLTEFTTKVKFDKSNFLKRNRIIAGLADAVIVVESSEKGGSLITADIAQSYDRDVFAVPGNINQPSSLGCNKLIKDHKAAIITSADDIDYYLNWDVKSLKKAKQAKLLFDLSENEEKIYALLRSCGKLTFDQLARESEIGPGELSGHLLNLEFNGFVKSLPGKAYVVNA